MAEPGDRAGVAADRRRVLGGADPATAKVDLHQSLEFAAPAGAAVVAAVARAGRVAGDCVRGGVGGAGGDVEADGPAPVRRGQLPLASAAGVVRGPPDRAAAAQRVLVLPVRRGDAVPAADARDG